MLSANRLLCLSNENLQVAKRIFESINSVSDNGRGGFNRLTARLHPILYTVLDNNNIVPGEREAHIHTHTRARERTMVSAYKRRLTTDGTLPARPYSVAGGEEMAIWRIGERGSYTDTDKKKSKFNQLRDE